MAKYIDQAGAQHFAEALMASTKTIGGQTIWGSGDIEAGGGTTTVTLTSAADFDTYKTVLESTDYKIVLFNFNAVDLTGESILINNATLISNIPSTQGRPGGSNIKCESITFKDCRNGSRDENPVSGYPGLLLAFEGTNKIQFINCHITFGPAYYADVSKYFSLFGQSGSVALYQSYIECFRYSIVHIDTPDILALYDSTIKGFTFAMDTVLKLRTSTMYSNEMDSYPIANRVISCDLSGMYYINMDDAVDHKVITNTSFEYCKMPSMMYNGVLGICNTLGCLTAGSALIYAAPGDVILQSVSDFGEYKNYLACASHKNVYLIEPSAGFNLSNGNYVFNNCTLYTFDYGAVINNYGTLKFTNCKTGGHISGSSLVSRFCSFYFGGSGTITFDECDMNITYHNGYTCIISTGDINIRNTRLRGAENMEARTLLFDEANQCLIEESCVISGFKIDPAMYADVYISFGLEPQNNENGITFTNCHLGSNFAFYAETNTYLEATQFINCYLDMGDSPSNQGDLFNVQRCRVSSTVASYCHPYILSNQQVDETAAGGFNTIL